MKVNSVEISNIRSYDSQVIEFDSGITLLYGRNGAGKSTILQSIFAGLYQTRALDYTTGDTTLDMLVNRDSTEGFIKISFTVNDNMFTVKWTISVDDERSGSTESCVLRSEALPAPVTGVRSVRKKIVDITGMSAESFINSVFVQQGDIAKLVEAGEKEKKEIIDGLLGLNRIDSYINRMKLARRELGREIDRVKDKLENRKDIIEDLDEESDIENSIDSLEDKLRSINSDISDKNSTVNQLKKRKNELRSAIELHQELEDRREKLQKQCNSKQDEYEEKANEIEEVRKEIDDIDSKKDDILEEISSTDDEEDIEMQISQKKAKLEELRDKIREIKLGELESIEDNISFKEEKIDNLSDKISEQKKKIEQKKTKIGDIEEDITDLERQKNEINDETLPELSDDLELLSNSLDITDTSSPGDIRDIVIPEIRETKSEKVRSLHESFGQIKKEEQLYEELQKYDNCGICGKDNSNSEFNDELSTVQDRKDSLEESIQKENSIQDTISRLESVCTDIINCESRVSEISDSVDQLQDTRTRLQDEVSNIERKVETHKSDISSLKQQISSLKNRRSELNNELNDKKENEHEISSEIDNLESDLQLHENLNRLNTRREHRVSTLSTLNEMKDDIMDQLSDKKQELEELKEKIQKFDYEEHSEELSKANEAIERISDEIDDLEVERKSVHRDIAQREQELETIRDNRDKVNILEEELETARERKNESTDLIDTYKNVKREFRKQNTQLLNHYTNNVFKDLYQNDVYNSIRVDDDYNITLMRSDGTEINPDVSSGGEGTLVNISLRAGIYRLLADRDSSTSSLPPLIFDEPTTYLDDSHVDNLQSMIDNISSWNVNQVFIVSHDDTLIQTAENAFEVTKNKSTELSSVSTQS